MEMQLNPPPKLTSTQKGSIGEALIGAQLMLASAGRLSPYRPLADDDGTDILVADKLTGRVVQIQVKANYSSQSTPPKTVQYDIRLATFKASLTSFLLGAIVDPADGALWRAWLIPTTELRAISVVSRNKLAISPNPSLTSRDRYAPWRCKSMRDVVGRLLATA